MSLTFFSHFRVGVTHHSANHEIIGKTIKTHEISNDNLSKLYKFILQYNDYFCVTLK
jgi:hypothetical protein